MAQGYSPTLRRRRLAADLRRLRDAAGMSAAEAARQLGRDWTESKVLYIESKAKRPGQRDIEDLLDLYGVVEDDRREELLKLAGEARKRSWWFQHRGSLTENYSALIDFESEADTCSQFEMVVPGLLQTADYARALILGGPEEMDADAVEELVQIRMQRQQRLLDKDRPLRLMAIMDEVALRRIVGSPEVMRAQAEHLLEMAARPNITLQTIPFSAGAHAGTLGSFAILAFPEPEDPDAVYVESIAGDTWYEAFSEVQRYRRAFEKLTAIAMAPLDTIGYIAGRAGTNTQ